MKAAQTRDGQMEEIIDASGISPHLWWLYGMMWLLLVQPGLSSLVQSHPAPGRLLLTLTTLPLFVIVYAWFMWPHPLSRVAHARSRSRLSLALVVLLTTLALVLSLVGNPNFFWLFVCVSAAAGVALPTRSVIVVVVILMVLTALVGAEGIKADWHQAVLPLVLLVLGLGLDMMGLTRLFAALQEMHAMRKELARLKVEEEHERLSRDVHDLLGQTLSLITLKSELARSLVKEEPDRCLRELSEIERVARKSLREVREAVAGYRQPRLESELEGARQLLEAAGISCQIEPLPKALPPELSAVLAWTVREGVTNVIRHSRAQHCLIRLTWENETVGAEVINDGGREVRADGLSAHPGLGLAGLRERVTALGGRVEAGLLPWSDKDCFRLWVELPLQSRAQTERAQREQA